MQVQEQSITLIRALAADREARRVRLGMARAARKPKVESIDPTPFYKQMWFYDLVEPQPLKQKIPTVIKIRDAVCEYFGAGEVDIVGNCRRQQFAYARQVAFYLSRHHTPYSYPQIARRFGDRDHTTILHGVKQIERRMKSDWTVAYDVAHVELMI